MDTAMRDLDQLRERGDETTGRKLGLFALAGVLSASAVFAMGIMIGRGDDGEEKNLADPLAELALAPAKAEALGPDGRPTGVKPETLSFPNTLVDRKDPLVEATIRAAEAEHAALANAPTPVYPPAPSLPPAPAPEMPAPASTADLPAASVAMVETDRLERVAQHDPLVAQALPDKDEAESAPRGYEGAYTLQVVSYEASDQAERFAKTLRTRGHKAFVTQADVPGRGRYYRVRVGPFETRQEATSYQGEFENSERLHTILVANKHD